MTEGEWWSCSPTDLDRMLAFLHQRGASTRKVWLFACACCRGIWPLFTDPRSQAAVEVAERYVDGLVSRDELQAAGQHARAAIEDAAQPRALSIMVHRITRCEAKEHWWTAAATAFADLLDASWRRERFRACLSHGSGRRSPMGS